MMIANIVLLNLLWFTSVIGAANGLLWPAAIVLSLLLGINYFYLGMQSVDFKIIAFSILAGLILDGFLMHQGWIIYVNKTPGLSIMPPVWIMFLWIGFGASIKFGMQWLLKQPKLGGLVMFVAAPLGYVSAAKLGAISLPEFWPALLFIGVSWVIYFIGVVYLIANIRTFKSGTDHAVA